MIKSLTGISEKGKMFSQRNIWKIVFSYWNGASLCNPSCSWNLGSFCLRPVPVYLPHPQLGRFNQEMRVRRGKIVRCCFPFSWRTAFLLTSTCLQNFWIPEATSAAGSWRRFSQFVFFQFLCGFLHNDQGRASAYSPDVSREKCPQS